MEGGARLTRDHIRPAQQLERDVRKCPPARFEEFTYVGVSAHRLGPRVIAVLDVFGHERQQSVHLMGVTRVYPLRCEIADPLDRQRRLARRLSLGSLALSRSR